MYGDTLGLGGFITTHKKFRLGGKKYRLQSHGYRSFSIVVRIIERSNESNDVSWLVRLRPLIREIEDSCPRAALTYLAVTSSNPTVTAIATWLRGRCGGTAGVEYMMPIYDCTETLIRKELTRCLIRMSAWPELHAIAKHDPSPRIRRMATFVRRKTFDTRLEDYCASSKKIPTKPNHQELFVARAADISTSRQPKPIWKIREILERIQRLVGRTPT